MNVIITNPETVRRVCEATASALALQLKQERDLVLRAIRKNHADGTLVCVRNGDTVCLVPAAEAQVRQ